LLLLLLLLLPAPVTLSSSSSSINRGCISPVVQQQLAGLAH
jgi:hypothetical protein